MTRLVLAALAVLLVAAPAEAQTDVLASATLTSTTCPGTGCVALDANGRTLLYLSNTLTGSSSGIVEVSADNATWHTLPAAQGPLDLNGTAVVLSASFSDARASLAGWRYVRYRLILFTSGSQAITLRAIFGQDLRVANFPLTLPALTKGTRPSQGFTVQQLQDTGRANVALTFTTTAPTTSDTVVTALVKNINAAVITGAQSILPGAGNTLRLQSASVSIRTTTAATPWVLVTLRESASGTCTAASSVVAYLAAAGTAAVIGNSGTFAQQWPDGWQVTEPSGHSLCISVSGNVTTNVLTVSIQAVEF